MHRYDPTRRRLAIALAALAGFIDAIGFVEAGGYFVSFMSGNTTRLGVDLSTDLAAALTPLGLIACFTLGAFAGALLVERYAQHRKSATLGFATILLVCAYLLKLTAQPAAFVGACAIAMGALNNAFSRDGEVQVGVTYFTGALVRFAQGLARRIAGKDASRSAGYGWLWLGLATGSLAGASSYGINDRLGLQIATAAAFILFAVAWRLERQTARP